MGGYPKPPPLPIPSMIDIYTPAEAKTRKGFNGQAYELVFSDEFEVDGRSFYKGAFGFPFFLRGCFACFWVSNFGSFSFWRPSFFLFMGFREPWGYPSASVLSYLIFLPPV